MPRHKSIPKCKNSNTEESNDEPIPIIETAAPVIAETITPASTPEVIAETITPAPTPEVIAETITPAPEAVTSTTIQPIVHTSAGGIRGILKRLPLIGQWF